MTNAQLVLEKIKETLCHEGTTYKGRSGTYKYVVGKTTAEGTINGVVKKIDEAGQGKTCLLYTSPSPRDRTRSRMPSSA